MHPSLENLSHRPWPLPPGKWKWRQSWLDLAFIHYRVSASLLEDMLPTGIRLQKFDGSAWVGVVPFRMDGVMRRPLPDLPFVSSFFELNLRTYVEVGGRPGVWFLSLDASARSIVFGGRHFYGLPYFHARIRHTLSAGGWYDFSSIRRDGDVRFTARYRPTGAKFFPEPGTFAHWAVERYCLYSHSASHGIQRVEVHHAPWLLQSAEVEVAEKSILNGIGGGLAQGDPVCHFSPGVHAISFEGVMVNPPSPSRAS